MKYFSFILVFILSLFVFIVPCSAQVANGAIPSAALEYFEGVVTKLPSGQDYFLYRSGDYTTNLITSKDLCLDGTVIKGTNVTIYQYNQRGSSSGSYNYNPEYTVEEYDSYFVDTNTFSIAYSSLGDWAELTSRVESEGFTWVKYILWSVVLILLIIIAFKLLKNRRSYINL